MLSFVLRRSLQSLFSIVVVITAVFFIARFTGNPADLYLPIDALDSAKLEFAELHGLNDPLLTQLGRFLTDLTRGDLGESLRLQIPATAAIADALPTTLRLGGLVMSIAFVLAVLIGAGAALRIGGVFDRVASGLSLAAASIPEFWIAIVGILVLAVWLRLVPSSGMETPLHWVLPVAVLLLKPLGILVQVVRGTLVSSLSSSYVKTAIAKGASPTRVLFVHCLRNALLPVVTVASDLALSIFNGATIVEIIFGFTGVGRLMLDSVLYRDYTLLQAIVICTALIVFVITAMTDILYAMLDPRVRNV